MIDIYKETKICCVKGETIKDIETAIEVACMFELYRVGTVNTFHLETALVISDDNGHISYYTYVVRDDYSDFGMVKNSYICSEADKK
jgi:hypothetical protein